MNFSSKREIVFAFQTEGIRGAGWVGVSREREKGRRNLEANSFFLFLDIFFIFFRQTQPRRP